MPPIVISTWRFGLAANQPAWDILKSGGSALDAVIQGVEVVERDPRVRSVGYGGYPNAAGEVEVDAAVVDGRTLGYGAVAARSGFFAAVTNNAENHLCESRYFFDRGGIV